MTDDMKTIDVGKMAKDNWKYVESLLKAHGADPDLIKLIRFHYLTAYEHGYFRAADDLNEIFSQSADNPEGYLFEGVSDDKVSH